MIFKFIFLLLMVIRPLVLFSDELTYYIKSDGFYKGSAFLLIITDLKKENNYSVELIGYTTNHYFIEHPHTSLLKLIALPLQSPDKVKLQFKENNEIIAEDILSLRQKPIDVSKIKVKQKYVQPPRSLYKRLKLEYLLTQKVKNIKLSKRYFNLSPMFPVDVYFITTPFGYKRIINTKVTNIHYGLDIAADPGTPIKSIFDGKAVLAQELYYSGNTVFIHHGDNLISMYAHLQNINVTNDQIVKKGDIIGTVGSTGRVTGPHLHLGIFINGISVDPLSLYEILR